MNINKYINLLILAGLFMYSCSSGDDIIPNTDSDNNDHKTSLSILLNNLNDGDLKSSGNPEFEEEKKIYSLEVIIFRSEGEIKGGEVVGHKAIPRTIENDKYVEIDEITGVELKAGKRDIYVIANAPYDHFKNVTNYQDFLKEFAKLSEQGYLPHPPGTTTGGDDDLPIGGINPSDLKTSLTMCGVMKNAEFSNLHSQHYLGYKDNGGLPSLGAPGQPLVNGGGEFYLERLVARVAVNKIEFDLPQDRQLPFEGISNQPYNYTYQIDSVFMMNVKTTSTFEYGSTPEFTEKFGHGNDLGYSFLNARINNLHPSNEYTDYLFEAITTPYYDITTNSTPLWFYTFENEDANYPTYLVIGVKYNFESKVEINPLGGGVFKTVKSYYHVKINEPGKGSNTHNYIKRNYQYQITATIRGLGSMYGTPVNLKTSQVADQDIEITETVGQNLFPWTGDTYRQK